MPKPKTKDTDLKSVGGRIRKARIDTSLTIKELSEKAGVSFAYLGMIERGERNPSDQILSCVADVAGISFDWLKNGDNLQDSDPAPEKSSERIDVSLFLSIILHEIPEASPKTLSQALGIDEDALNRILNETDTYDPIWYNGCAILARNLDIPKLLGRLSEIEYFLKREQISKDDFKVRGELCTAMSKFFHDKFEFYSQDTQRSIRCPNMWSVANEPSEPTRDFIFQQASSRELWRVTLYIPLIERYADRLNEIVSKALATQGHDFVNIALVFSDKDSFDRSTAIIKYKIQEYTPAHLKLKKIVVMLIDPDSSQIMDNNVTIIEVEKVCSHQTQL